MTRLKVGSFNAHDQRVAMATAANECDLLLGSETVQFAADGWKWRAGGKGVRIGWRESVFTAESTRWHKAHDGKRFSLTAGTPTRGTLEVRGHLADGTKVCLIDGHRINGTGWEGNRKRAGWQERRRMWLAHDALDRTLIAAALADGYTVLLGSDVNRRDMPKPHPDAVPLRASGITQLWLIPAPGVTHTLHGHGALDTGAHGTTHRLQWADLTLAGKATPPKETGMARSAQDAIAWGRSKIATPGQSWERLCLSFVRQAFGLDYQPSGAWPNADRNAGTAWDRAAHKHRTSNAKEIPAGVPVFWELASVADHVALSIGGGRCLSNDINRMGKIDEVSIDEITRRWNGQLLGWTEDLVGNTVWTPPVKPALKPTPNITRFRLAPTRALRRKWAEAIRKVGGPRKRAAASAWIAADNAHTKALADKKAAYRAVVKNEVKS